MENTISLKKEGIEINGNNATVTLKSPFSITRMPGKNLAEQEPEANTQDDQGDNTVVRKEFRFISEVIIEDCWCPFDLTKNNVLKAALPLFKGLGLFKDHYKSVDNNIGGIQDAYYDESSTPKGINGFVCVDKKIDPLTAIRVEKGWINRCSITLSFDWIQSHDIKPHAFFDALGEIIDDEMVRLIVTKITSITEVSLVYFGADPNAKALSRENENALNNNALEVSGEKKEVNKVDEEIRKLLEAAMKKDIKTDLQYSQAVKDALKDLDKLKTDNQSLEAQVAELRAAKEFQDTVTQSLRDDVLKDARKVGMGKVKTRDEMLINQADYDGLLELKKDFQEELENMFPGERRSSVEIHGPELEKKDPGFKTIHG